MWNKKRKIEDTIMIIIFIFIINIGVNISYFIWGASDLILGFVEMVNVTSLVVIGTCLLLTLVDKIETLSPDENKILSDKMKGLRLLSIVFIAYIGFSVLIVRNLNIIISSIMMFLSYINFYIVKKKSRAVSLIYFGEKSYIQDYNNLSHEEPNLLWRIKPMCSSHVSVRFVDRIKNISFGVFLFTGIFIYIIRSTLVFSIIPIIAVAIIMLNSEILYILEVIFGIYTETEGICTGVVRKRESDDRSKRTYYDIYVTDFEKKRELKFRQYDSCIYLENDSIKLIHGCLSKKIIEKIS